MAVVYNLRAKGPMGGHGLIAKGLLIQMHTKQDVGTWQSVVDAAMELRVP
jgi:hypothetical protein